MYSYESFVVLCLSISQEGRNIYQHLVIYFVLVKHFDMSIKKENKVSLGDTFQFWQQETHKQSLTQHIK